MQLNKTYTIVLMWLVHFYIFYGIVIIYANYESDTLHTAFRDFKSSVGFIISIPIVSLLLGVYYPIFLAIIVMIILINYKKFKFYKSYLISMIFFYIGFLILFLQINSLKYDFDWIICLISTIITNIAIFIFFRKAFIRLDTEYSLR